jgi:hypothetical protein
MYKCSGLEDQNQKNSLSTLEFIHDLNPQTLNPKQLQLSLALQNEI